MKSLNWSQFINILTSMGQCTVLAIDASILISFSFGPIFPSLWHSSKKDLYNRENQSSKLQRVMNSSARLIYRAHKFCHITPLLAELHWLPVRSRIHYKILLITFKVLHGLSPKYLSDLISIQQPLSYNLRRNDNGRLLERPSAKTKKTMGDRAFQVAAPFLWNKLPRSARDTTNLESFKTLIKTFLFKESFHLSQYIYIYTYL